MKPELYLRNKNKKLYVGEDKLLPPDQITPHISFGVDATPTQSDQMVP